MPISELFWKPLLRVIHHDTINQSFY